MSNTLPHPPMPIAQRAEQKPSPENTITQIISATDAILSGQAITHCECPPDSLTPAQQLMRHALIQRGLELAEQGTTGTSVAQVDLDNCPDCTYCEQDYGLLADKAFEVVTLGRASNCMATGDTEGIAPTLNFICQHCGSSRTANVWIADTSLKDGYREPSISLAISCRYGCHGVSIVELTEDVCCATEIRGRAVSEEEANAILTNPDVGAILLMSDYVRRRLSVSKESLL